MRFNKKDLGWFALALVLLMGATTPQYQPLLSKYVIVDGGRYARTDVGIQAAINSLGGSPGTVYIGAGTATLAAPVTITHSGQHLVCGGMGAATLSYTATSAITAVVDVGTASDGSNNLNNTSVEGCTISGNSHATYGLRIRGVHRSVFRNLNLINVTTSGLYSNFAVADTFDNLHTSGNEQAFSQIPQSCISLDGTGAFKTTDATVSASVCEGVSGDGWYVNDASGVTFLSGTSEGNGRGANLTSLSQFVTLINNDFEVNSTEDILQAGSLPLAMQNVLCASGTQLHMAATAGMVVQQANGCALTTNASPAGMISIGSNSIVMPANFALQSIQDGTIYPIAGAVGSQNSVYGYHGNRVLDGLNGANYLYDGTASNRIALALSNGPSAVPNAATYVTVYNGKALGSYNAVGGYQVAGATVIPSTATGSGGSGTLVMLGQTCTTGSIGGGALAAGATATGTCTLGASATGHTGRAAASDGSVQGNYIEQVSVSGTTATVTVTAVTAGTPTAKTYNVTVF